MTVKRESAHCEMSQGINVQYNRLGMYKLYLFGLYLLSVMNINIGKYFNILLIASLVATCVCITICISSEKENQKNAAVKYP